jgi:hypothetical protein
MSLWSIRCFARLLELRGSRGPRDGKGFGLGTWSPALTSHPSDEDLSPGTPEVRTGHPDTSDGKEIWIGDLVSRPNKLGRGTRVLVWGLLELALIAGSVGSQGGGQFCVVAGDGQV